MSWYYLDNNSEAQGPYEQQDFIDYYLQGIFNDNVLVWSEQESWGEWKQFKDVQDLQDPIKDQIIKNQTTSQSSTAQELEVGTDQQQQVYQQQQDMLVQGQQQNQKALLLNSYQEQSQQSSVDKGQEKDLLKLFQQEMAQIDQSVLLNQVKQSKKEPEEKEFVDDDGTKYVWDKYLKKYVVESELEDLTFLNKYDEQAMVFDPDQDKIPTIEDALEFEKETERKAEQLRVQNITGKSIDNPTENSSIQDDGDINDMLNQKKRKLDVAQDKNLQNGVGNGSQTFKAQKGNNNLEQLQEDNKQEDNLQQSKKLKQKDKKSQQQQHQQQQNMQWHELKFNTSVYVTNFPLDVTLEEIVQVFEKCGLIKKDENNVYKVKIYRDKESGILKGDGVVTYLNEASVSLACTIMDGAPLRHNSMPMTVTPAKFQMQGDKYIPQEKDVKNRKKIKQYIERQQKNLGWGGYDDKIDAKRLTVILENMFTLQDVLDDENFEKELQQDIESECSQFGQVEKVQVCEGEPSGIVSIKFKTPEATDMCINKMQGRFFAGQQLQAYLWDGVRKFNTRYIEGKDEQMQRLDNFVQQIEQGHV